MTGEHIDDQCRFAGDRYRVVRAATGEDVTPDKLVLSFHDPAALPALGLFASLTPDQALADDVKARLASLREGGGSGTIYAEDNALLLSEHFPLRDAVRSDLAARNDIDNRVPIEIIPRLELVARTILEPCRAQFGGRPILPSSWWRSQALERKLKWRKLERMIARGEIDSPEDWVSDSQHARGEAVDFEIAGVANLDLAHWIADNLEFDQLILELHTAADPRSGWVHCSRTGGENRGEILTTTDGANYTPGLPMAA